MRRQCRGLRCPHRKRDGIRGAVCCLNLSLFPYLCMVLDGRASEANTCELLVCIEHRRSWTPRAFPPVLWAPCCRCAHKGDAVGSSRINCVVRSSLLRFASVLCVNFFTRHCSLFEPTIYLGSARRRNANVQSPECASIGRVGSLPTPFSRACGVCGFLRFCDLSVFASLVDVYRSRHQTLGCNWNCVLGYTCKLCSLRACWHRERLFEFVSSIVLAPRVFREF